MNAATTGTSGMNRQSREGSIDQLHALAQQIRIDSIRSSTAAGISASHIADAVRAVTRNEK